MVTVQLHNHTKTETKIEDKWAWLIFLQEQGTKTSPKILVGAFSHDEQYYCKMSISDDKHSKSTSSYCPVISFTTLLISLHTLQQSKL